MIPFPFHSSSGYDNGDILTISLEHLPHWGRVTHICVSKLSIIASDNGLSPVRRQAIVWTSAGILLIGPWGTNFSDILIDIHTFSFKKIDLKMSSAKWRPFFHGLNVLNIIGMNDDQNSWSIGVRASLFPHRFKYHSKIMTQIFQMNWY